MTRQVAKTLEMFESAEAVVDARTEVKEFEYHRDAFGLYRLQYTGGGEVPALLKGRYTSSIKAKEAADSYLEGKRNAE